MNDQIQEFVDNNFPNENCSEINIPEQAEHIEEIKKEKEDIYLKFEKSRIEWSEIVKNLTDKLKNIKTLELLMIDVYSERQRAVDYYHYLNSLVIKITKAYRKLYAERYDFYTNKSQIRYPNETVKNNKIYTDLSKEIENKDVLENHVKYISETIKTIDGIIYAINSRIKIEELMRGA